MTVYVCDGCLSSWFVDASAFRNRIIADLISCPICAPKEKKK